jgi:hypothetical protein
MWLRKPSDFLQLLLYDFEFAVAGDQFRVLCLGQSRGKRIGETDRM